MINQQLLDFIRQQSQQGATKEQISGALTAKGWPAADIAAAFSSSFPASQSATLVNTMPAQSFSAPAANRAKKIWPLVILLIIIGGLALGGGAWAYWYYFPSPERVLQKMMLKLPEIKSLEYALELKSEVNTADLAEQSGNSLLPLGQLKENISFSLEFSGKANLQETETPSSLLVFNVSTDALSSPDGRELVAGAEVRTVGDNAYIKLSEATDLVFFDLSAIKNQWIKADLKAQDLSEQVGLLAVADQASTTLQQALLKERTEKIILAVKQAKIIKITGTLPSENLDGVKAYHYKFSLDKAELRKLFVEASRIIQEQELTEEELADFDKSFAAMGTPTGEIWVGQKDFLPYKIYLNFSVQKTAEIKTPGQASLTLSFKNFDQPLEVEEPIEAKSLEEALNQLFSGFSMQLSAPTSSPLVSDSANLDTDQDGLSDQLEAHYGTDPNNSDTDGDGYQDGEEVANGYDPNGSGKLKFNEF